jgi:hypothetical protein
MRCIKMLGKKKLKILFFLTVLMIIPIFSLYARQFQAEKSLISEAKNGLRSSDREIALVTPQNITYTQPMAGYYPATHGFEDDENGIEPSAWNIFGSGGTINVISNMAGHNKILEFRDTSGGDYVAAEQNFGINRNVNGDAIEFWWRTTDSLKTFGVTIYDDGKTGVLTEIRIMDGYFKCYNGVGWQNLLACNNNNWYHCKIVIDFAQKEFDWFIDETFKQLDIPFLNNSVDNARSIYMGTSYSQSSYYNYIDAIGYSWDPNYNIGDDLNEGVLLSFTNSTTLDWIGYSLDGQENVTIHGNHVIPFLDDGIHSMQLFCNDTLGDHYETSKTYFSTQISSPLLMINYPLHYEYFGANAPMYSLNIQGYNIQYVWYHILGTLNNVFISSLTGQISQVEWDFISSGEVLLFFFTNDSHNRIGNATISIFKDTNPPISWIIFTPISQENSVDPSTTFTIISRDEGESGVALIRYRINYGTWNTYTEPFTLASLNAGTYIISYQAVDAMGNVESEKTITVDLTVPFNFGAFLPYIIAAIIAACGALYASILILKTRIRY